MSIHDDRAEQMAAWDAEIGILPHYPGCDCPRCSIAQTAPPMVDKTAEALYRFACQKLRPTGHNPTWGRVPEHSKEWYRRQAVVLLTSIGLPV